jgi:glycosyltransferase involved in cell wall biosynthesis
MAELDIVIPVYNERENILRVLDSLDASVRTPCRVLICYDRDEDDTLPVVRAYAPRHLEIGYVKNRGKGAFGAVVTGFEDSSAPAVLVYPADDDYNAHRIDAMVEKFREGCDIVAASRFMPGGVMKGAPPLKAALVRSSAFALHYVARLPTHDPSNGLRLFSQRVIRSIPLESTRGFTYSIELLVKCHRLGWRIGEVAVEWHERNAGSSRFQVVKWLPDYLHWFGYAFKTTYLLRGPSTVRTTT